MTAANRVQVTIVRESVPGTTPTTPRMRIARLTGESLSFTPNYIDTQELRADRMLPDPIKVMQASEGAYNFELHYPEDNSPLSEVYRSAFFNPWTNTPTFDNDGTADSVVTDAGTTADTYVVASGGAAVVTGHLVRASGFTTAANNQVFRVASSTATTIVGSSLSLVAEAAPPATAKLKVVGFQGAAGDITALADGLGSTVLNFTTLGLSVYQFIKIGGTAAGDSFAVTALNNVARITAIAANKLTLDNLPTGWATNDGAGKTLKVWFGDRIKNGVTASSMTIEKGFLGQTTPTYIVNTGMQVNTLSHTVTSRNVVTGTAEFMGLGGGQSTTTLDASPDAPTAGRVMAANADVNRLAEAGVRLTGPNYARESSFQITNNLRTVESVDAASPVGINEGECTVTGRLSTYFGNNSVLQKLYEGTPTSLNLYIRKDSQALIWQFPRITLRSGVPAAGAKNTDVTLDSDFQASWDTLSNSVVMLDRFPYVEL